MARTWILPVDFWKLNLSQKVSGVVIRLMMAVNDILIANACLERYKNAEGIDEDFRTGACRYFVNLQCGHLHEGLKIIGEIAQNETLRTEVHRLPSDIQEAFEALVALAPGGSRRSEFENCVAKVRNKAAFHYYSDAKQWIHDAIERRAGRPEGRYSKISYASGRDGSRLKVADDINDTIVTRYIWKIPEEKDVAEEANKILEQIASWAKSFRDFGWMFTVEYVRQHGAAR